MPSMPFRFPRPVLVALAALASFCTTARADDFDRWYEVRMSGAPAGWSRASQSSVGGHITTKGEFVFKLKRGPIDLEIAISSTFVETQAGKPLSMTTVQKMGAQPVETEVTFTPDSMTVVSTQDGRVTRSTRPYPKGDWLTPAAAGRYTQERIAAGETDIVVTTIDPNSGLEPIKITRKIVGPATITVGEMEVKTTKSLVEASIAPGVKTTEYSDSSGLPVKSETQLGGLHVVLVAAGPEVADAKAGEAPEMMVATFVRPDRPIENPRKTTKASYMLSMSEGELPEIPAAGSQRVESIDDRALVIVNLESVAVAPAVEAGDPQYRASSTAANLEDPAIQRLAKRATAKAGIDKAERAEAIRRYVYRYIRKKNLDVAFATASEVAKTRAGDCSEHGVLTAALLRADGIPSRVVVGMIYVDQFAGESGIFGYHMWTQALLEVDGQKKWVDLDATLPNETPFDAAHIALGLSSMADDQPQNSMIGLATMLGRVKVSVEHVE